ncbi:hypothetical protein SLA2020_370610 [Shorea laevis]
MAGVRWHQLQLIEGDRNMRFRCWLCEKPPLGSRGYKCVGAKFYCDFFLHESCPEPTDKKEIKARQHDLSDKHHLISMKEIDNNGENKVVCSVCEEPVSCLLGNNGPTIYKCSIPHCSFLLHQPCSELPYDTIHPLHLSDHNLHLIPPTESQFICAACGKLFSRRFYYYCINCYRLNCNYRLHITCASHWQNITANNCNPHAFTPIRGRIEFTCETCGVKSNDFACHCSNCLILIHSDCAKFLGTIKIRGHGHSLTCTFSLSQGKKHKCEVCYEEVDTKYAAYCCDDHECDYIAHLRCAYWIRKESETSDSLDYATHLVEGNDLKEDEKAVPQEIQHLSHPQHKLVLKNEELQDVKSCEGCMQFIVLPPFYCCVQCNFSLHIRCTKLPKEVMRPLHHKHPLTLQNVDHSSIVRSFWCQACYQRRSGFNYRCVKDSCPYAIFDAQCILIPEAFKHKGHQHYLLLGKFYQSECNACGQRPNQAWTFDCTTCGFRLCIKCAILPLVTRHRYDTHLLYLSYAAEDDSREYYCQICEEKRDEKLWFYYCKDCDFAAHPRCILGKLG